MDDANSLDVNEMRRRILGDNSQVDDIVNDKQPINTTKDKPTVDKPRERRLVKSSGAKSSTSTPSKKATVETVNGQMRDSQGVQKTNAPMKKEVNKLSTNAQQKEKKQKESGSTPVRNHSYQKTNEFKHVKGVSWQYLSDIRHRIGANNNKDAINVWLAITLDDPSGLDATQKELYNAYVKDDPMADVSDKLDKVISTLNNISVNSDMSNHLGATLLLDRFGMLDNTNFDGSMIDITSDNTNILLEHTTDAILTKRRTDNLRKGSTHYVKRRK